MIDPAIKAQLERSRQAPQDDGDLALKLTGETAGPATLRGSLKQIEYARSLRQKALDQRWSAEDWALLVRIADSSWWIANRFDLPRLKFKAPAPAQLEGAPAQPQLQVVNRDYYEALGGKTSHSVSKTLSSRANEAADWAHSVSQDPRLAEAALCAVMSKLYRDKNAAIADKLKDKSNILLQQCEFAVSKDTDAIRRMLL
jgi:hypothetical protein